MTVVTELTPALRQSLASYLAAHNTMTLATLGPDGPAAAALFYAADERFRLYFLSEAGAAHVANLQRDRRVALTIHEDYRDWRMIQGVQMRGIARRVDGPAETARALQLYLQKFPFLETFLSDPRRAGELLSRKLGQSRFHVVEPRWARWIDNRAGFGTRYECDLTALQEADDAG
jgi:uncharacterized protein YhbP (UPF0306 family)